MASRACLAAPDFARDVRPIFERSCFSCHGADKQKSGYRLDIRDIALKGGDSGKPAIIPHNAKASRLIRFVSGEDDEIVMPPRKSKVARLADEEIQILRDWIDAGPQWPDTFAGSKADANTHWSLRPLVKPAVPGTNKHPIDAFIHKKLTDKNLRPSPEADRRALIRRVTYDLTGLPPSPEEVKNFQSDKDPRAYEKLVARLLDSPRYGERWARHWLDTIHFADSHGYEHDIGRDNAWRFRDYVIESLNKDISWPRFIREQLAADFFYPDEPRLTAALGYLGAGTFDLSAFSTAPIAFSYLDRDDLVTQTMAAFVSATANCARCHAHKFDPIPQEDYYSLQAVFAGILKGDVSYDADPKVARDRKRWKALKTAADKKDGAVLFSSENAELLSSCLSRSRKLARWERLEPETFVSIENATFKRETNGVILATGSRAEKDTYIITAATSLPNITALRLNVVPDESLPKHGPGRQDNGNLHLSEISMSIFEPGITEPKRVKFRRATADFNQDGWGIERAIDGDLKTAWGIYPAVGQPHHAVFELSEPLVLKTNSRLSIVLKQAYGEGHLIGAFNLAVTADNPIDAAAWPAEAEEALAIAASERSPTQRLVIAAQVLGIAATEALASLPTQSVVYAAASSVAIPGGDALRVVSEPKVVNVLERGDFDKPRAVAEPGALSALTNLPARFALKNPKSDAERRAALADWLAASDNVLTWRSIVNRVWHYHFGRGLCDTLNDFGKMGGTPSHPELIDWLAIWFRDEAKGSLKQLHRLIVTSETYRQSSQNREEAAKIDVDNRLLWRQNRLRLDADSFRDFTLSASGALDLTMGGPAIKHFSQGPGPQLTPALNYSGFDWSKPGASRRSIYRYVWRGISDPFMESLDFPDLGLLAPVRGFSASSLQALTLFNNDFVLYHSLAMAKRAETEAKTLGEQVDRVVELAWLRLPKPDEREEFVQFAQARGLPALCRLLLNSNEFLFVD